MFSEERTQTFFIDQTDLGAVDALSGQLDRQFDLVIDDGLHSPNANVAALVFGLRHVKPGGYFEVENIPHRNFWCGKWCQRRCQPHTSARWLPPMPAVCVLSVSLQVDNALLFNVYLLN